MARISKSTTDEKFFNLDGLLYQKGNWEIYYDSKIEGVGGVIDTSNIRVGLRRLGTSQEPIQSPTKVSDWYNGLGVAYTNYDTLMNDIVDIVGINKEKVNVSKNDLGFDAWGRSKSIQDISVFHSMFTHNIPVAHWAEIFNGTERSFTSATSINGKLSLVAGATLDDVSILKSYRNPRYEPNRGHLYSVSLFLPSPDALGNRKFGFFTSQSGVFFSLESGTLYAVVRTTIDTVTTDDKYEIDIADVDLSKGNVFDIQMQWRGVGNIEFFINLESVKKIEYLGTRDELTTFNPANPVRFESENKGDNVVMYVGCVDVTSEGGRGNGKTYGSVSVDSDDGQVAITGLNVPIIAIRSKSLVGTLINNRDTLALLASAYADQRAIFRIWQTRDFTAITENDQSWRDFGDGHLEYIVYDTPNVTTPMTFNTAKADLMFGCRISQDFTYDASALFEDKAEVWLTPQDMFIFTVHRETGLAANAGVTFEFAETI